MAKKSKKWIVLTEETEVLFNEARIKYFNDNSDKKLTNDLVIREALKKYLGVSK